MSVAITPELAPKLSQAYRVVETLVFRTNEGPIFTADIGEMLLSDAAKPYGAKVTLVSNIPTHIGIVEGDSVAEVQAQVQLLISQAIAQGPSQSAIPKPHFQGAGNLTSRSA